MLRPLENFSAGKTLYWRWFHGTRSDTSSLHNGMHTKCVCHQCDQYATKALTNSNKIVQ